MRRARRLATFGRIVADWPADDVATLTDLLVRFNDSFVALRSALLDEMAPAACATRQTHHPWSPAPDELDHARVDHSQPLTHRQILTILSGLMAGMFLAALDQTIVATSIRTIADDLQGLSVQAWATTAYLITATISTPLYGKLSDLYGRRPFFLARDLDLRRRLAAVRVRRSRCGSWRRSAPCRASAPAASSRWR